MFLARIFDTKYIVTRLAQLEHLRRVSIHEHKKKFFPNFHLFPKYNNLSVLWQGDQTL